MIDAKLLTLITLVEEKKYIKTADKLFISQPAVTQHIKALEKEYDIVIFSNKKTLELTKSGAMLLEYAKSIKEQEELLVNTIKNQALDTINVGITPFAFKPVFKRINKDNKLQAKLEVNLYVDSYDILKNKLSSGNLDFIICDNSFDSSKYDSVLLFSERIILASNQTGKYKDTTRLTRELLQQANIVMPSDDTGMYQVIKETLKYKNIKLKNNILVKANSLESVLGLTKLYDGVSYIYESSLDEDYKRLDLTNFNPSQNFYLLYNRFSDQSEKTINFIKVLKEIGTLE